MADMLLQFASLLIFIFGIILGEVLAHRAFGAPKNGRVMLLDVIIIVFLITVFYSYVGFYELGPLYYLTNFLFGAMAVLVTRAVLWAAKLTRSEILRPNQALEVIRVLARNGLDTRDIRDVLKQMGLKQKAVEKYEHLIERTVPPYMPKVVKMEKRVESIEKRLSRLERSLKGKTGKKTRK